MVKSIKVLNLSRLRKTASVRLITLSKITWDTYALNTPVSSDTKISTSNGDAVLILTLHARQTHT